MRASGRRPGRPRRLPHRPRRRGGRAPVRLERLDDTLGHAAGDRLLVALAESLTGHLRVYDVVARFSGDEFLCVMPDMTLDMAPARLDEARGAMTSGPATFTYGLALLGPDDTANTLVARADAAMYDKRTD